MAKRFLEKNTIQQIETDDAAFITAAGTTDTLLSEYIDTLDCEEVTVLVTLGDNANTAKIDCKLTEADTAAGVYSDVAGAAITQIVCAAADYDYHSFVISAKPTKRYVKVSTTRATANSALNQMFVIKTGKRYAPVTSVVSPIRQVVIA